MLPHLCALVLAAADAGVAPIPVPSEAELDARVQAMGTREGIAVASVTIGSLELETDDDGRFTATLTPGEHTVRIAAPGYKPLVVTETLADDQRLQVVYRLERNSTPKYETTIRDQRARTEVARVALAPAELRESAGTMGEPLRAVMQLPGVASVVSGLAYPVVRGTQPAATAYFLDGIRIPQLFHALAGPSVVSSDFIDQIEFFPGVPPARFGRLLGGAIEATSAKPLDRLTLTGSIDLINASAFALVPITKSGTRITAAAARVSYTPLIGARVAEALIPRQPGEPPVSVVANFYDYQARIEQQVGRGRLRLLAFGSGDEVGTRPNGSENPSGVFRSLFHRVDLMWTRPLGPGAFEVGATFGHDVAAVSGEQTLKREFDLSMKRTLGSARLAYNAELTEGLAVRAGAEVELQATSTDVTGIADTVLARDVSRAQKRATGMIAGAFVQVRYREGPFETLAGLRFDAYGQQPDIGWMTVEPRLEQRVRLSETLSVRAAAGLFHQPPTLTLSFPVSDVGLLDEGLQSAVHSELGADVQLPLGLELGLTGFYNPILRAVEHPVAGLLFPSGSQVSRPGVAYGVELLLRRAATGLWFGWISATLQRSERLTPVYRFGPDGEVLGRELASVPSAFDQTLVLHAVVGLKLPRGFSAGAALHFNTGRPETGELGAREQKPAYDPVNGMRYWVPKDLDQVSRLPPFFRADLRLSKLFAFPDWTLELYLDVMNISLTREVLAYDYRVTGDNTLERNPLDVPVVLPMLGVKGRY